MIRRRPSPTLFPYTTLFRSDESGRAAARARPRDQARRHALIVADTGPLIALARLGRLDLLRQVVEARVIPDAVDADRKSTRLNSSHTVISYAVFCLKKKKAR